MSKTRGMCHLCGGDGPLTFEHIPPKRVFNHRPILLHTIETMMEKRWSPRKMRRGMGRTTICSECNGFAAHHYGSAFAEWTAQAMRFARVSNRHAPISIPFEIEPLRVIKQILAMALAATDFAGPDYLIPHRRFVLFPFERYVPPEVRVFAYFNPQERYRLTGNSAILRNGRSNYVLADIAFPPLGYCVTHANQGEPPLAESEGLCDITWFAEFGLRQKRHQYLSIPRRTPYGPCPLAFAEIPDSTVQGGTVLLTTCH